MRFSVFATASMAGTWGNADPLAFALRTAEAAMHPGCRQSARCSSSLGTDNPEAGQQVDGPACRTRLIAHPVRSAPAASPAHPNMSSLELYDACAGCLRDHAAFGAACL